MKPRLKLHLDGRITALPTPAAESQLLKLRSALGPQWQGLLGVADETVRTWRKRGAVPLARLLHASKLSGQPVDWFIA